MIFSYLFMVKTSNHGISATMSIRYDVLNFKQIMFILIYVFDIYSNFHWHQGL